MSSCREKGHMFQWANPAYKFQDVNEGLEAEETYKSGEILKCTIEISKQLPGEMSLWWTKLPAVVQETSETYFLWLAMDAKKEFLVINCHWDNLNNLEDLLSYTWKVFFYCMSLVLYMRWIEISLCLLRKVTHLKKKHSWILDIVFLIIIYITSMEILV